MRIRIRKFEILTIREQSNSIEKAVYVYNAPVLLVHKTVDVIQETRARTNAESLGEFILL